MTKTFACAAAVSAAAALLLALEPAAAQEKITLRAADQYPATGHYFADPGLKFFMERVTKATNGQVQFQHYPAEQLGKAKDLLALTISGVTDIGSVIPSYTPDKTPLSAVAELPGAFTTACEGTMAYWKLARDGILAQKEFQPTGVRVLLALTAAPYQALMREPISSIKDLEGKKIRTFGQATDLAMRKLNATPIRMSAPEIHESMQRGTLDGTVISYGAAVSYGLGPLSKSVTTGEGFGSAALTYVISEKRWQALPENVRKAMLEAGEAATRNACELMDKNTSVDLGKLEQQGVKAVKIKPEEVTALHATYADVAKAWASELDGRGKPGSDILKAYQAAVKAESKH